MRQDTLIGFCRTYDGIKQEGIPVKDYVTKELLISCCHAQQSNHFISFHFKTFLNYINIFLSNFP